LHAVARGQGLLGNGSLSGGSEATTITFTDSFADERGTLVPATYYGMSADIPLEMVVTVTLQMHEGKTRLALYHDGMPTGRDREDAREGWNESFDKLANLLAGLWKQQ